MRDTPVKYRVGRVSSVYRPRSARKYDSTSGVSKEVVHYHGDASAPRALDEVENGIDRIVNVEQWIGTSDEQMKLYSDWLLSTATP